MADEFDQVLKSKSPNPKDEFEEVLRKNMPPESPGKNPGAFLKYAAPLTPELLSIIGGFTAGPAGAGLGSVAGTELKNEFPSVFGEPPSTLPGLLGRTGLDVALGGGIPKIPAVVRNYKAIPSVVKGTLKGAYESSLAPAIDIPSAGHMGRLINTPIGWPLYGRWLAGQTGEEIGSALAAIPITKGAIKGGKQGLEDFRLSNLPQIERESPTWTQGPEPNESSPPPEFDTSSIPQTGLPSGRAPGSLTTDMIRAAAKSVRIKAALKRIQEGQ